MTTTWNGRRVLVTGASSGIGAAMARDLAAAGAVVAMCARRRDLLDDVLTDCRRSVAECKAWTIDLTELDTLEQFVRDVESELGGIDVLVSDGPVDWCKPIPESDATAVASHYPELSLRTERAHREAYVALPNDALSVGPGGNPGVHWQLASEALEAWAEEGGINPQELELEPEDLGVRITYFASEPVTETSAPYCDFAVPFA